VINRWKPPTPTTERESSPRTRIDDFRHRDGEPFVFPGGGEVWFSLFGSWNRRVSQDVCHWTTVLKNQRPGSHPSLEVLGKKNQRRPGFGSAFFKAILWFSQSDGHL
jgi:hypothetical protein